MGKERRNKLGTKRTITGIPAFAFLFLSILTKFIFFLLIQANLKKPEDPFLLTYFFSKNPNKSKKSIEYCKILISKNIISE